MAVIWTPSTRKLADLKPAAYNPRRMTDKQAACLQCGKMFSLVKRDKNRVPKYCSRACYGKSIIGHKSTEAQKEALACGRYAGKKIGGWKLKEDARSKRRGSAHHAWRGGITPINAAIRNSPAMKNWKREIFERDNFTCQVCGKRGGRLVADHIKPFSLYPDLRLDVSNGRTICKPCDLKSDTYGGRAAKHAAA